MRVRTPDYGGTWAPVFDSAATRAERESTSEVYWPVSLSSAEMVVIVCSTTRPFPSVVPPPVLSTLPLRVPTVGGETGGGDAAESDMLLLGLQLSCVRACAQVSSLCRLVLSLSAFHLRNEVYMSQLLVTSVLHVHSGCWSLASAFCGSEQCLLLRVRHADST